MLQPYIAPQQSVATSDVSSASAGECPSTLACQLRLQTSILSFDSSRQPFYTKTSNYIPLGSLEFGCNDGAPGCSDDDFGEIGYIPACGPADCVRSIKKLFEHQWIAVSQKRRHDGTGTLRVYALPWDRARAIVKRRGHGQFDGAKNFMEMMKHLDPSLDAWNGYPQPHSSPRYQYGASSDNDSLFYIFNTLPSPPKTAAPLSCPYSSGAIEAIYDDSTPGLKTPLYQYQKRAVATMIRREVQPKRALDPRLQPMRGPTGVIFYLDCQKGEYLLDRREYDEARGGILGESMGLGKTLICLAVILSTRGHWPTAPPECSIGLHPTRTKTASLAQMAAAAAGSLSIPWKPYMVGTGTRGGKSGRCYALLRENGISYVEYQKERRHSERTLTMSEGRSLRLCSATLVIVPQNLLSQWQGEIQKHIEEDALDVLCLDAMAKLPVPSVNELLGYDVILMTRQRLIRELVGDSRKRHERWQQGPGSPLLELHFLRVILDEGHEFTASRTEVHCALMQLHVERRWIVSGTPTSGLIGAELGAAVADTLPNLPENQTADRQTSEYLMTRRKETALEQELQDIARLGGLCCDFLKLRPWANQNHDDTAKWNDYIRPGKDGRRKSTSLRSLLESLVVRHRIEDIKSDLQLPPLYNKTVYLRPNWHDKININLFILNLTVNAITSERVDGDYMFHPRNRAALQEVVRNLRNAAFYWTGHTPRSVEQTIHVAESYLSKSFDDSCASTHRPSDYRLLRHAVTVGQTALRCYKWKAFGGLHEMGIFVDNFPVDNRSWSVVKDCPSRTLTSVTSAMVAAQNWVDTHLYLDQFEDQLMSVGFATIGNLQTLALRQSPSKTLENEIVNGSAQIDRTLQETRRVRSSPKVTGSSSVSRAKTLCHSSSAPDRDSPIIKSILKKSTVTDPTSSLPSDDARLKTKIVGTASAKLSYLLDRLGDLHSTEKSLVFFEDDNIAVYISQALDLLSIPYLIYASTLAQVRKTAYIHTFNNTSHFRVLIMNVHQAAHGLHIAVASRVFFVNPIWQPNVEAQAIKRAHRIGQTRPVYVETLILEDTLEDHMLKRRRRMNAQEHQKAHKSLLEDNDMSEMIKNATFIPFSDEEINDEQNQIARLSKPQQLFGRQDRAVGLSDDPDADLIFPDNTPKRKRAGPEALLSSYAGSVEKRVDYGETRNVRQIKMS